MWYWHRDLPNHSTLGNGKCPLLALVIVPFVVTVVTGCVFLGPKEKLPPQRVTEEGLTALLHQREAAVHSMKGLFSARVRGRLIPIVSRFEGAVYYRRPNALRLKGFTPIGNELFELVQVDDWYKLRLPSEGKVYTGRQSDMKDLGKLARFSQLSAWAVGGVLGTSSIAKDEIVKLVEDRNRYRLDVYASAAAGDSSPALPIRRLWFDRRLFVVQEDRLGASGEVEVSIQYDDFRQLDEWRTGPPQPVAAQDIRLVRPFKISLEDGRGQGSVQVTFHEMHHNQAVKAEDLGEFPNRQ